jgi:hypothetical protein
VSDIPVGIPDPCTDPFHRLHDLVGAQAVQGWLDTGAPTRFHALVMALLDDLPEHLYLDAVRIMVEVGWSTKAEEALADPHAALVALAMAVNEIDPFEGETV